MPQITPYKIHIPDSKLQRLQQKLELTDFPQHEIEDAGWKYGTPLYLLPFPSLFLSFNLSNAKLTASS
jgi:hypothetical protein